MRYLVIIFCILLSVNFLIGEVYHGGKLDNSILTRDHAIFEEDDSFAPAKLMHPTPPPMYGSRDGMFTSALVDSSLHGYGMYINTTNPIEFIPGVGVAACYRQWQGENASSGYIGVAQSSDGVNWMVSSAINSVYPYGATPDGATAIAGQPAGRYPSLVGSVNCYPTPIWNENTTTTGGGTNGGRAMYTYDQYQIDWSGTATSFASPIFDLNNGCNPTPCDPPDLWLGQPQIVEDAAGPVLFSVFVSPLNGTSYWMLRSNLHMFGYFFMSDPVLIYDELDYHVDGYTGHPEFHINNNGIGYMGVTGYWHDYETGGAVTSHTLFYKKTTDYGLTWESTGGLENSGFSYISDAKLVELYTEATEGLDVLSPGDTMIYTDPDTMIIDGWFLHYNYDIKVDDAGGLHLVAQTLPAGTLFSDGSEGLETRYPGAGIFHLYNPTPENPDTWTASLIRDMHLSNEYTVMHTATPRSGLYFFSPELALSNDNGSQSLWCVIPAISDTSSACANSDGYCDIDLFLMKSEDNGASWTELGNMTNTPTVDGIDYFETSAHIAPIATDTSCYFIWQVPDWSLNTINPDGPWEIMGEFKQWVYVGSYVEETVGVDAEVQPNQFSLNQNYPNPFNPTTRIEYNLAVAGDVTLTLHNIMGQKVLTMVDKYQKAGNFDYVLDATELPSGIYFYSLTQNGITKSHKLVLMK